MITREILEKALCELPKMIFEAELALYELETRIEATERQLKIHRARVAGEIATERTENGKARFSNETAREMELERRLSENVDYNDLAKHFRELQLEARKAQAELHYQLNRMKVAKLLVKLVTAEEEEVE